MAHSVVVSASQWVMVGYSLQTPLRVSTKSAALNRCCERRRSTHWSTSGRTGSISSTELRMSGHQRRSVKRYAKGRSRHRWGDPPTREIRNEDEGPPPDSSRVDHSIPAQTTRTLVRSPQHPPQLWVRTPVLPLRPKPGLVRFPPACDFGCGTIGVRSLDDEGGAR